MNTFRVPFIIATLLCAVHILNLLASTCIQIWYVITIDLLKFPPEQSNSYQQYFHTQFNVLQEATSVALQYAVIFLLTTLIVMVYRMRPTSVSTRARFTVGIFLGFAYALAISIFFVYGVFIGIMSAQNVGPEGITILLVPTLYVAFMIPILHVFHSNVFRVQSWIERMSYVFMISPMLFGSTILFVKTIGLPPLVQRYYWMFFLPFDIAFVVWLIVVVVKLIWVQFSDVK